MPLDVRQHAEQQLTAGHYPAESICIMTLCVSPTQAYPTLMQDQNDPDAKPGDVVNWIQMPPITFDQFYERQAEWWRKGYRVDHDDVVEDVRGACPVCGNKHRIFLTMLKKVAPDRWDAGDCFLLCLHCYTAIEEIPIDAPKPSDFV